MTRENRKFDEYIENKLRNIKTESVSPDFTKTIMERVKSEYKVFSAEAKSDRTAKIIISGFITLMLLFIFSLALLPDTSKSVEETSVNFHPAIDTSTNYLEKFITIVQEFFINLLGFLGLSFSYGTLTLILGLVIIFLVYWAADRFILKDKLRSLQSIK